MNQKKEPFREYLHSRGISDKAIDRYGIIGDSEKIHIPIQGFNKYRTFPNKRYFYDKGFKANIFGLSQLENSPWCVLTEGELDALRLASEGIPAVSGTGGAGTWNTSWNKQLPSLVYICYDTDEAGQKGALKVHWSLAGSRILTLPEGKDVTEFLQNHSKDDFLSLLREAKTIPQPLERQVFRKKKKSTAETAILRAKEYPISNLIQFTRGKAKCIWHKEKTPSMHYYPDNHVYCFGCSKGGDAIAVYMTLNDCTFEKAIEALG